MPWVDRNGVTHVGDTDKLSPANQHHIITCPTCSTRYPHVAQRILQHLRENAMPAPATIEAPPQPIYILDHSDRCDKCGARAYVETVLATGSLKWCRHDYLANQRRLEALAIHINNETQQLFDGIHDDGHVTPGKEAALPRRTNP